MTTFRKRTNCLVSAGECKPPVSKLIRMARSRGRGVLAASAVSGASSDLRQKARPVFLAGPPHVKTSI